MNHTPAGMPPAETQRRGEKPSPPASLDVSLPEIARASELEGRRPELVEGSPESLSLRRGSLLDVLHTDVPPVSNKQSLWDLERHGERLAGSALKRPFDKLRASPLPLPSYFAHGGFALLALLVSLVFCVPAHAQTAWLPAKPGWTYEWPRDHASHPGFKTEWWYFTGNVRDAGGRRFGYELTFFRQGIRTPDAAKVESRFVQSDIKLAHFAITDVSGGRFHFWQRLSRGAFGEAGYGDGVKEPRLAWNGNWSLVLEKDGSFRIAASADGHALSLHLQPQKPMVVHGKDGYSRKSESTESASHYYSATRMASTGTLTSPGGAAQNVTGESWFDHEWASNQLAPEQTGWDWFSIQFEDGTELMLYQLRKRDGSIDTASSGTWVERNGTSRHLANSEMKLTPTAWWTSPKTGGRYPIAWRIEAPPLGLDLKVTTPVQNQELALDPVAYWEGFIEVQGARNGVSAKGHGYLELTGYAGEIVGLK